MPVAGTPVINITSRTMYFDALTMVMSPGAQPPNTGPAVPVAHVAWALDIDTGMPMPGWPVNISATLDSQVVLCCSAISAILTHRSCYGVMPCLQG